MQCSLQAIVREQLIKKLRRLSVLRITKTNSGESLRVLLRLLIDIIVEDLSRLA